jgi:hypothetical protein
LDPKGKWERRQHGFLLEEHREPEPLFGEGLQWSKGRDVGSGRARTQRFSKSRDGRGRRRPNFDRKLPLFIIRAKSSFREGSCKAPRMVNEATFKALSTAHDAAFRGFQNFALGASATRGNAPDEAVVGAAQESLKSDLLRLAKWRER